MDAGPAVTTFLLVCLGLLSVTLIAFFIWRVRAHLRGEGFVVRIAEDYHGGVPPDLSKRLKKANHWLQSHPFTFALSAATMTGLVAALLLNLVAGIAIGVASGGLELIMLNRFPPTDSGDSD
jgi:hypothetical protein